MSSRFIRFIFILILAGCVSADKNNQELSLNSTKANPRGEFAGETQIARNDKFLVKKEEFHSDSSYLKDIFSNFIVDNQESALKVISRNYIVVYVNIENLTNSPQILDEELLKYISDSELISPIHPSEFPQKIYCINWKGNIKNIYNLSVFTAVSVFVVGAVAGCVLDNKCENMKMIDSVLKIASSGETDPEKSISSPVFITNVKYKEVLNSKEEIIEPHGLKRGILVYPRPILSLNRSRALNFANCLVE